MRVGTWKVYGLLIPLLIGAGFGAWRGWAAPTAEPKLASIAEELPYPGLRVRARKYAPWDPGKLGELRRRYGLVGPGPQGRAPEPAFPSYLKVPRSVEELMPAARAAVTQTGGRVPLGLVRRGEVVAIFVPWDAHPMVQEAVRRAFAERGVEARILYENELAGVRKEDLEAIRKVQEAFRAGDGHREFARWFFDSIPDEERAKEWLRKRDPELFAATWPELSWPSARLRELDEKYPDLVTEAVIRYLDRHPEVNRVFWRQGGRPQTARMLRHHGRKFVGNYTYVDLWDILSQVPAFPADLWRLIEQKTIEPLAQVDRVEMTDPEGSALWFNLTPEEARAWSRGVYLQGHLFMFPNQATGRWPYSMVNYPELIPEYIPPVQVEATGVIAGTNNHTATFPRIELHVRGGKLYEVRGGGLYGEIWRHVLHYPGTRTLTWPFFRKAGYWWLFEGGTGTNPKYFKHPDELLFGRNSSERNVGGVIHWSFGAELEAGPERIGHEFSPRTVEFAQRYNVPLRHCCHVHNLLPTYQVRIRGTGRWETLINWGRLTALDDPEVRALAARYGRPEEILRQDYVPAIPGITMPGRYEDYARDPGSYWMRWAQEVREGRYRYFKP